MSKSWLPFFIVAVYFTFLPRFAFRNTRFQEWVETFVHNPGLFVEIGEVALRRSLDICTPVFLGFALTQLSITHLSGSELIIKSSTDMLVMLLFFAYLIFWLWYQRLCAAYAERALRSEDKTEFTTRRIGTNIALLPLNLIALYMAWLSVTLHDARFVLIGVILGADLLYQLALMAYCWGQRRHREARQT